MEVITMGDTNKVVFGIEKVVVWPILSEDAETGTPTYGTKIPVPGARSLGLDFQGDIEKYYADNVVYYQTLTQAGEYQGDLTIYHVPEDFLTQVMMQVKNKDGVIMENSEQEPREFAMAFQFSGDKSNARHLLYKCKATKPSIAGNTIEENKEPEEQTLSVSAVPRLDNKMVKVKCFEGDAAYENWYEKPYEFVADEYEEVQSPTGNPSTSGYYEKVNEVYVASKDTTVDAQKTYYTIKTTP